MPKKKLQVSDLFAKLDVNKDGFVFGGTKRSKFFYPEVSRHRVFFDDLGFFCSVLSDQVEVIVIKMK